MFSEISVGLPTDKMKLSPGTRAGDFVFCSQVPLGPDGKVVPGGIEAECRQLFENFKVFMAEAGGSLADVVQLTVFMIDQDEFHVMDRIYREYFTANPYPSRATAFVSGLTHGMRVEVTAHAYLTGRS